MMTGVSDGHAIGVPAGGPSELYGPGPAYEPYLPYGHDPDQPLGPDEVELGTAHAHARAMAENGDLTGARSRIEEALAVGELRLGRDHAALVPLMVDLATIARRLGNLTEARNQLRRAYTVVAGAGGADHPTALSIEGRIAAVAYRLGESTEVYDRHLADIGVRVLGPEHPAIRGALQRLGQLPPAPLREDDPVPLSTAAIRAAPPSTGPVSAPPVSPVPVSPALPVPVLPSPYGPALEGDIVVPGPVDDATGRAARSGRGGMVLVTSLAAAVLIAGTVVALQLLATGGLTAPDPVSRQTPSAAAPDRIAVELTDRDGTVTLTWVDPSDGQLSFAVYGGVGSDLTRMALVAAPNTSATIYGTDPAVNYCFTVAPLGPAPSVLASERMCTHRTSAGAPPS